MLERGSKTLSVSVVWATFGIFTARSKWFAVAIGDHGRNLVISLWPGDKATINGVAAKIRWKSSRFDFFGIKTASSSLIIFQRAKLSTRNINHPCWCNWRTFWRKNSVGISQSGSCSCMAMPGSPGTCNPEETGLPGLPVSWSTPPPILWMWPPRTTTCSLEWKNTNEMSPFFVRPGGHCWRGDLVGRTKIWIFFEWLAKVRATGKKCIYLRGEYVE